MTNLSIEELMAQITKWQMEANSDHNDGWTRKHYQEKLDHIRTALNRAYEVEDPDDALDSYD